MSRVLMTVVVAISCPGWALLGVGSGGCALAPPDVPRGDDLAGRGDVPDGCDYPQVFGNAAHVGRACPELRGGLSVVKIIVQDPDADAENEQSGFLQVHESPPLTSGDFVVIPSKQGFVSIDDRTPARPSATACRRSDGRPR